MARVRPWISSVLRFAVRVRSPRMRERHAWALLLTGRSRSASAVLIGLTVLGALSPSSGQSLTWSVAASPSYVGSNFPQGVSCASPTACTVVGWYYYSSNGSNGLDRTLIESWDGTNWSLVPSPNPGSTTNFLQGVSCISASACTAAGYFTDSTGLYATIIESWNGTNGSVPSPNEPAVPNYLFGVSCVSASAWTAGGYYYTSSTVGMTLIEAWNGTSWSAVPSPNPGSGGNFLQGVSCTSASACMAVGSYYNTGGAFKTLIESWNGTSWLVVPSPNRGTHTNVLDSVSCTGAATACIATGNYNNSSNRTKTLIESWNGTNWSMTPSPNRGTSTNVLDSVSCTSAAACAAAGWYYGQTGATRTLIESWNGTSWSVMPSPNLGLIGNTLTGVSCTSAAACTGAGFHYRSSASGDIAKTLIEVGSVG